MKWRATASAWFRNRFEKAFVRRVKRRIPIRMVRLFRSANDQTSSTSTQRSRRSRKVMSWKSSAISPARTCSRATVLADTSVTRDVARALIVQQPQEEIGE